MSDDFLDNDFSFDDDVAETSEPELPVFTDFGQIQFGGSKRVTLFQSGQSVTLPHILVNGEPFSRGGMKEGGPTKTYFLAYHGVGFKSKDSFTSVRVFTDQTRIRLDASDVDDYPVLTLDDKQKAKLELKGHTYIADWSNLQYVSLKKAFALYPKFSEQFLKGKKLWFAADNFNTGTPPRDNPNRLDDDGNPTKYYDRYWYNFRFFDSQEEMEKARDTYFEERGFSNDNGGGVTSETKDYYPEQWKTDIDGMVTIVRQWHGEGKPLPEIAENAMLIVDGKPAQGINGESVPVKKVLSEILDIPEPMISLE